VTVRLTGLSTTAFYNLSVTAVDTSGLESGCAAPMVSAAARLDFAVSPTATVNFGSVNVGSSADQVFTVSNTAGGTVSGTISTSAPFSIFSGSTFSLVGLGATQAVTVRFTPTTSATASVNVSFAADGDIISRVATGTGVTVDTTPPTLAITTPTSGSTYSTRTTPLTITGTASDNILVTQVTWANKRGGGGTASGTTSWTASGIILQSGANVLTVTASDAAGNTKMATLTVTLDTTAPTVAITAPGSGSTYSTRTTPLTIAGTASDNIGVTQVAWVNNRGSSGTATGTASWTGSVALQSGANVLTVTASDAAGNTATASVTVTLDNTPPAVAITTPTSGATYSTSNSVLALAGTASDNIGVTQVTWANSRGGGGTPSGMPSWTVNGIVLQSGVNVLTVTAQDAVGNITTATLTVTLLGTFTFTDDPLVGLSTPIKAVHITEVRAAINSARVARGLANFAWTDPTLTAGSTPVKVAHLTELRTALNQAYQAAGRATPAYTDPTLVPQGTVIKAIHLNELRAAARGL